LIVANWKMNPGNLSDARKIFSGLKKAKIKASRTINVICPPSIFLGDLASDYSGNKFIFGAQDVSFRQENESTGEIGTEILKSLGITFVIVGHSERRALGETDEIVSLKARAAITGGLIPIICVGEPERDATGAYLRTVEEQLSGSLAKISRSDIKKVIIAYEPIWSIGAGHKAPSSSQIHQMTLFIRKILSRIYNRKAAMDVPILYGGSVDVDNCREIIRHGETDGLLIGRASLNQFVLADILKVLNK